MKTKVRLNLMGMSVQAWIGRCVAVLGLMLGMSSASAADTATKITGIYSDLTYSAEEGDVGGIELFVVNSNHGYYVVYQSAEGEPGVPVVIPAKVEGHHLRFSVPASVDGRGTFSGSVSGDALSGKFTGNGEDVHLKRKASYWQ